MSRRNTNPGQVAGRLFSGEACPRDTKKDAVSDPSRALRTRDGGYNKPKALGRTWSRFFITILVATFFPAHALAQYDRPSHPLELARDRRCGIRFRRPHEPSPQFAWPSAAHC